MSRLVVDTGDGPYWIEAAVRDVGSYLCVHRMIVDGRPTEEDDWTVSHRATGMAAYQGFWSEEEAVKFAEEADKLVGWDKIVQRSDKAKDFKFPKRLRDRLGKEVYSLRQKLVRQEIASVGPF